MCSTSVLLALEWALLIRFGKMLCNQGLQGRLAITKNKIMHWKRLISSDLTCDMDSV